MGRKFDARLPHMTDEELYEVDESTLNKLSRNNLRREIKHRERNQIPNIEIVHNKPETGEPETGEPETGLTPSQLTEGRMQLSRALRDAAISQALDNSKKDMEDRKEAGVWYRWRVGLFIVVLIALLGFVGQLLN